MVEMRAGSWAAWSVVPWVHSTVVARVASKVPCSVGRMVVNWAAWWADPTAHSMVVRWVASTVRHSAVW